MKPRYVPFKYWPASSQEAMREALAIIAVERAGGFGSRSVAVAAIASWTRSSSPRTVAVGAVSAGG